MRIKVLCMLVHLHLFSNSLFVVASSENEFIHPVMSTRFRMNIAFMTLS